MGLEKSWTWVRSDRTVLWRLWSWLFYHISPVPISDNDSGYLMRSRWQLTYRRCQGVWWTTQCTSTWSWDLYNQSFVSSSYMYRFVVCAVQGIQSILHQQYILKSSIFFLSLPRMVQFWTNRKHFGFYSSQGTRVNYP